MSAYVALAYHSFGDSPLLVTVGVSATPAEKNLDYHEEYYNSNHDAGTC